MSQKLQQEALVGDPEELFDMLDVVGEGSFGLICTCKNLKENAIYAIKFLEIEDEDEANLGREINILKESLKCPSIVQYYGCYIKDATLMIVMEFCEGGSCLDILKHCQATFSEDEIAVTLANMLEGLVYLHDHKILHRDLKAGNVLLTKDGKAKLADFGVSAKLSSTLQKKKTVVGSPYWMAPEVITVHKDTTKEGYDRKADIWSLGITAIELAEGQPPLFEIASLRVIFLIPTKDSPLLKEQDKWSKEFHDFLKLCLNKDPNLRPNAKELQNHPFIKRAEGKDYLLKALVTRNLPKLTEARKKKKAEASQDSTEENKHRSTLGRADPGTKISCSKLLSESENVGTTVLSNQGGTTEFKD